MSRASETFSRSILDAENLLAHFNHLNTKPPPPQLEVLKRAGLIMAMTAWETYVEDRVMEATAERLRGLNDAGVGALVQSKLDDEIRRLHNVGQDHSAISRLRRNRPYGEVVLEQPRPTHRTRAPQPIHQVAG